ncbi:MAG: hypothetical protein HYZ92_01410 [Candidatus Omnitrophica bacterium]|nr:hypothetical protein [Candidatus Omnitrophota bacterium]
MDLPALAFQRRLARLAPQELRERLRAIRVLSGARGLRFLDDHSRPRTIDVAAASWILTPDQQRAFAHVVRLIATALMRLPGLYRRHEQIRRILPFDPEQESWISLEPPLRGGVGGVLGRLDAAVRFASPAWRSDFQLLEPNAVGVGGVHYAPTACSVILDVFGDLLERVAPGRRVVPTPDPRRMLLDEADRVARQLGVRLRGLALLENTDFTTGTDEFEQLARYVRAQGVRAVVADPRQLSRSRSGLVARGVRVDLLYRDCELNEFIEMEATGRRLSALRGAIRQGRLISRLAWEFDHKSAWEIFTDPTLSRGFSPAQRRLFREHVPWTRLMREERVTDPASRLVDLPAYVRRRKERLVLKPNTLYGGQGVVVGYCVSQADWERTVAKALRGPTRYVVQRLAPMGLERFPLLDHAEARPDELRAVAGFFFSSTGVGLVGRFSRDPVVNVSRGGGLLSALMIQ